MNPPNHAAELLRLVIAQAQVSRMRFSAHRAAEDHEREVLEIFGEALAAAAIKHAAKRAA